MKEFGYAPSHILPHGSYLINLGNPDSLVFPAHWSDCIENLTGREKREKSYNCFLDDLKRCELLGLELYNFQYGYMSTRRLTVDLIILLKPRVNCGSDNTRGIYISDC